MRLVERLNGRVTFDEKRALEHVQGGVRVLAAERRLLPLSVAIGLYCAVGVLSGLLADRTALLAHACVVEGHRNETALFVMAITTASAILMIF